MNPDNTYQPEVDLPRPQANASGEVQPSLGPAGGERTSIRAELPQQSQPVTSPAHQSTTGTLSTAVTPPAPVQPTATGVSSQGAALAANDTDLIEKEWVVKAKAIIDKTNDNPHEQTKDMSKFKADYVKKRFNKELKVSEG